MHAKNLPDCTQLRSLPRGAVLRVPTDTMAAAGQTTWLDAVHAVKQRLRKKQAPLLEATLWCVVQSGSFASCSAALDAAGNEQVVGGMLSAAVTKKAAMLTNDKEVVDKLQRVCREIRNNSGGVAAIKLLLE